MILPLRRPPWPQTDSMDRFRAYSGTVVHSESIQYMQPEGVRRDAGDSRPRRHVDRGRLLPPGRAGCGLQVAGPRPSAPAAQPLRMAHRRRSARRLGDARFPRRPRDATSPRTSCPPSASPACWPTASASPPSTSRHDKLRAKSPALHYVVENVAERAREAALRGAAVLDPAAFAAHKQLPDDEHTPGVAEKSTMSGCTATARPCRRVAPRAGAAAAWSPPAGCRPGMSSPLTPPLRPCRLRSLTAHAVWAPALSFIRRPARRPGRHHRGVRAAQHAGRAREPGHPGEVPLRRHPRPPAGHAHVPRRRGPPGRRDGRAQHGGDGEPVGGQRRLARRGAREDGRGIRARFVFFANTNFFGVGEPGWGEEAAAQLEEDVRNGAAGPEDLQGPRHDGPGHRRQPDPGRRPASGAALGQGRRAGDSGAHPHGRPGRVLAAPRPLQRALARAAAAAAADPATRPVPPLRADHRRAAQPLPQPPEHQLHRRPPRLARPRPGAPRQAPRRDPEHVRRAGRGRVRTGPAAALRPPVAHPSTGTAC